MQKFIFQLVLTFLMVGSLCSCKDAPPPTRKRTKPTVEIPKASTKVAFIFPAGAGAMRVILGVTEQLQKDLDDMPFVFLADSVGGVSSGSLTAAGLLKKSPAELKEQLGALVREVFWVENRLIDKLVAEFKITLLELDAIFQVLAIHPPSLESEESAFESLKDALLKAVGRQPSLWSKIQAQGGPDAFLTKLQKHEFFKLMAEADRAEALRSAIKQIIEPAAIGDPTYEKLIAISASSETRQPVFFANRKYADILPGALAIESTSLHDALIASSAIPGFIKAPTNILFTFPNETEPRLIAHLIDGFFAKGVGFDPSGIFYDIFSKQFPKDDLLMIYVSNGAPINWEFRTKHPLDKNGINQVKKNNRTVTFVAIDTTISSDEGKDLFNLSGFYASSDLFKYMDRAVERAVESPAYAWVINALQDLK